MTVSLKYTFALDKSYHQKIALSTIHIGVKHDATLSSIALYGTSDLNRMFSTWQISEDVLDRDAPGVPVQAAFKSGPTGSHQFSITFVSAIDPGNHFRISVSSRII